jgi:methionyl-tRNA formyltransferase
MWCGYRAWSDRLLESVKTGGRADIVKCVADPHAFVEFMDSATDVDVVILAGWSWKIPEAVVKRLPCVGLHPSDLPKYRGGSPLQHQIIDGLTETQCSLFLLSAEFDEGPVLAKAPMSLAGNMDDIFAELVRVGAALLNQVLADWPNWRYQRQDDAAGFERKRRKPEESRLDRQMFQTHSLREIYNIVRALGDPYPNAYIEDEQGNRLLFKVVAFESGSNEGS